MALAGAVYVGGAMGMEAIGANHIVAYGYDNLTMALIVTLEEAMEIAGVLILLATLFSYLGATFDGLSYSLQRRWVLPVEDAKTDATRQRRIATMVQTLASEAG